MQNVNANISIFILFVWYVKFVAKICLSRKDKIIVIETQSYYNEI